MDEKPLLPDLRKVLRAKKGNKISRYFRLFFENTKVKKIIGTNLALLFIASSFLPGSINGSEFSEIDTVKIPVVLDTEQGLQFPVKNVKITQSFRFYHPGLDLDGITGDPIYPVMTGEVEKVEYSGFGYGNTVIIKHNENSISLYAHLSKITVNEGQDVSKETKLGEMGATGRAFGDHLHFEFRENGKAINPLTILH